MAKQYLTYLNLENPEQYQFGRIPSFVYGRANNSYYTTPDRKGLGYKIGSHNSVRDSRSDEAIEK